MSNLLIFDTETTGMIDWKSPSGGEGQPHIVQLAAIVIDEDTKKISQSVDVIIRPDGWDIPDETVEIHGITTEHALDVGVGEEMAVNLLLSLALGIKRIAYNVTFDNRIIRIATKRYYGYIAQDAWKHGEYECAMQLSRKVMGGKVPKLTAAYKHFTGNDLENAHSAMADTLACKDVYFTAKENM